MSWENVLKLKGAGGLSMGQKKTILELMQDKKPRTSYDIIEDKGDVLGLSHSAKNIRAITYAMRWFVEQKRKKWRHRISGEKEVVLSFTRNTIRPDRNVPDKDTRVLLLPLYQYVGE